MGAANGAPTVRPEAMASAGPIVATAKRAGQTARPIVVTAKHAARNAGPIAAIMMSALGATAPKRVSSAARSASKMAESVATFQVAAAAPMSAAPIGRSGDSGLPAARAIAT